MRFIGPAIVVVLLFGLAGCAARSDRGIGMALEEERWDDAIALLEERVSIAPANTALLRDLGRAFLEAGRYDQALARLRTAARLDPDDRSVPLLIGLCHEGKEEWQLAIDAYRKYPGAAGGSGVARAVRGRMARLVRRVYARRATALLEEPEGMSGGLLAVRYFDVLAETETYGNLGRGIAERLITDISRVKKVTVVPRLAYESLRQEVERSRSLGYDPLALVSLDAMLGAGWSLGGTILPREDEDEIKIDFFLVNNSTGEVTPPSSLTGSLSDFFELEKRVAFEVVEKLGVVPTLPERQAIARIPTTNFRAFLAYCDALEAEDRGNLSRSRTLFEQAVRLDPDFVLSSERAERTRGSRETIRALAALEIDLPEEERRARRIERTAAALLPGPVPGRGDACDLSNVRPLGSASLTLRVDRP